MLACRLFAKLPRKCGQFRGFINAIEKAMRNPQKANLRSDESAGEDAARLICPPPFSACSTDV